MMMIRYGAPQKWIPDHRLALVALLLLLTTPWQVRAQQTPAPAAAAQASAKAIEEVPQRVFSGLQPGEKLKPFRVLRVQDDKVQGLDIGPKSDDGTTLLCFVHRLSNDDRILFGLGLVDFYAARYKSLTSHIVLLSDDREKITTMLRAWARGSVFSKSLVSLSLDGGEGPGYYGLNRKVAMTVLVAQGDKVVSNLVFQAPNQRDLHAIMVAVAKAMEQPEPSLAKVQQELRADRQRRAEKRIKASPVYKLAPHEELGRVMFGLVNSRGNRSLNATRRSKQLREWASDDKQRQAMLKRYCQAILAGDFSLDRYARAAIEELAADEAE